MATLIVVGLAQTLLLPSSDVATHAQWSQASIGWCLLPLLFRLPLGRAAAVLCGFWTILAAVSMRAAPTAHVLANIGLGTASILTVQLLALMFYGLIHNAAHQASLDTEVRTESEKREAISAVLRAEYRQRYAERAVSIRPLLQHLAAGAPLDAALRRHADTEHQRLRALFDQTARSQHALLKALQAVVSVAQSLNIAASLHLPSDLPTMTETEARRIADALAVVLVRPAATARITVTRIGDSGLQASIVTTGLDDAATIGDLAQALADPDITVTSHHNSVWLTVDHRGPKGDHHYVFADTASPASARGAH